jgi:hypothetical protein
MIGFGGLYGSETSGYQFFCINDTQMAVRLSNLTTGDTLLLEKKILFLVIFSVRDRVNART